MIAFNIGPRLRFSAFLVPSRYALGIEFSIIPPLMEPEEGGTYGVVRLHLFYLRADLEYWKPPN